MNFPDPEDFIDIHDHGGDPQDGIYTVNNLLANEQMVPDHRKGMSYTYGIHPWHIDESSLRSDVEKVEKYTLHDNVIAAGEAGYDKLRGPSRDIQRQVFEAQVRISELRSKPLYIHCVKAWDELILTHKNMRPSMPWLVHGFRGKPELAKQLLSRGMYISFWFDFIVRPESSELVRTIPAERIFLETDGSREDLRLIYKKVSGDLNITIGELKKQIFLNFNRFFGI